MFSKIIKDYNEPQRPEVRVRVGRFAGIVGIVANILLFAVKLLVGIITSSISVIADSINNLSDTGSNIITVVGYSMSGKPADKDHPYGHERIEYISSLIIAIFIGFFGVEMLITSIETIITPPSGNKDIDLALIIIMSATVLVKIAMAALNVKLGKHINSQTLKASAIDSIGDVFATLAVVAGMIITKYTSFVYTDAIIGIIIAVYIIIMGVKLVIETSNKLIGQAPDGEFTHSIISKIKSYEGVLGIHDLVIHTYGEKRCFATVHVEIDADANVMHSHDLMDIIEADFLKDGINLVIHMDPISVNDPETKELRAECMVIVSELSSEYSSPVSLHDFRIVKGITHTNIIFDVSVTNEIGLTNKQIDELLTEKIKALNPLYNLVLTVDRDYFSERFGEEE
ncbi:MAG: cation transporter [Clostridia bacterium]|nr:cation transporter [Clostridia bacterium]